MPDLLPKGLLRRLRLLAPLFVAALSLYALPVSCLAQTVPASLRACTAESDSSRRLACYDREMARLSPSPAHRAVEPAPPVPARAASPMPAAPAPNTATAAASAAPATPAAPPVANEAPAPTTASRLKRIFASSGSWHMTARVARLDRCRTPWSCTSTTARSGSRSDALQATSACKRETASR